MLDGNDHLQSSRQHRRFVGRWLPSGPAPPGDGWHNIEIRVTNNGGPGGLNNKSNWTTYSVGYAYPTMTGGNWANVVGGSILGTDFIKPVDPGNGSLFRTPRIAIVTSVANDIVLGPGGGTIDIAGSTGVTFSGSFSGPLGSLTKTNTGSLVLTNTETYAGNTTVSAGALLINGSIPQNATLTGGLLGGTGSVAGTITSGGAINPGTPTSNAPLTTGNVTFTSGGSLAIDVNATANDELLVNGTIDLTNASLTVNNTGYAGVVGSSFTILHASGGILGGSTFAGLPEGAIFSSGNEAFQISYAANSGQDVTLTRIQEVAPTITSGNQTTFTVGANGSFQMTATGVPSNFNFSVPSGSLPTGVSRLPPAVCSAARLRPERTAST